MTTRILIADDHERVRATLSQSLRSIDQSWEVHEAEDGQAAVEKAVEVNPNLVILDLRMPRLDGLKAGRIIKKLFPNTTMVLFTFTPPAYLKAEAQEAGFHEVVDKPDSRALLTVIRKALSPAGTWDRESRCRRNHGVAREHL